MIDDLELPPVGVIQVDPDSATWRVWAPKAKRVDLVLGVGETARRLPMEAEPRGYHSVTAPRFEGRYAYSLDGGEPLPDPISRRQPDGVSAPSAIHFPGETAWDEGEWRGVERGDLVIYELHVGTFTQEGTFDAIHPRIAELLELGVTAIELMPVAAFPGDRSWGYDGVLPFAVQECYGGPEGLKRLVEACHRAGMAVLLDVIYNHFGPEGDVFPLFGDYLTDKYKTDWGPALNYDGQGSDAVRAMVLDNVRMWVGEYRFDGLRLDAADQIYDRSPRPILAEIAEVAHREGARLGRPVHVFAETDLNDAPRFLKPEDEGGYGLGGHWTDDFHHAVHATLTGEVNGYYVDFADGPVALARAYSSVFVNNGCYSAFRGRRHGASADAFSGDRFVAFTQNHDQVGNRAKSDRYAASLPPAAVRLAAGILLLAPRIPLLFMGEEYGETNPFPFFSDFSDPKLVEAVREGRKKEFAYFGWTGEVPDPFDAATRDSAILSWNWDDPTRAGLRKLYRELLHLRRKSPILRDFRHPTVQLSGSGASSPVLVVTRQNEANESLRVYFNLGQDAQDLGSGGPCQPPSFRSEIPEYGAKLRGKTNPMSLAPWEFALFGPIR